MIVEQKNRLDKLFESRSEDVLSIYYTAGFPQANDTLRIAEALESAGADMIEIGIPFSDPVADGPTIQESNKCALDGGMTLKLLFEQLTELRKTVKIPVVLMGYINPVIQFGISRFCEACAQCGIDGVIIPDLPIAEYLALYKQIFEDHGLKNIFLITPQTSESRIRFIDEHSDSFIYMVSSASITGSSKGTLDTQQKKYFERVQHMNLKSPLMVGFGISNRQSYTEATERASGAIIGSAFIRLLQEDGDMEANINNYIKEIKGK